MIPKRIGILIPSTNTSVEADFQRVLSDEVTVHSERLHIPDGTMTAGSLDEMNRGLDEKVQLLASARMDVIVYACTSGSFYRGSGWDEEVKKIVEQNSGVPCVTTSMAVTSAFKALSASMISVMTPYPDWANKKLAEYYTEQGLNIRGVHSDPRAATAGHRAINDQDPVQIEHFARNHFDDEAEALFLSCTAWRSLECVLSLELALNVPVVTSNQATIWAALKAIGRVHTAKPIGQLFAAPLRD